MEDFRSREIELFKLGFEKNEHQYCFHSFQNGSSWVVDFHDIYEPDDVFWDSYLIGLKEELKVSEREYHEELKNSDGYKFAQKEIKKLLVDKYNGLNSIYKELSKPKLSRRTITENGFKLEGQVELLRDLINKFK